MRRFAMWTIVAPNGACVVTEDVTAVNAAIDMDYKVFRNGKRVW
jgi:hypothetical protein